MDELVLKKVDEFFKKYKRQEHKKGTLLIRADEDPSGIFYLTKGRVKEYAISKKGDELIINIFKPPSFFPMSWAVNKTLNVYYFEAVEDIEIYKIPEQEALNYIKNNPDVLYDLLTRVYKGTDGLLMRMVYLMSGQAYARVVAELLISAGRFGKIKHDKVIELTLTEKDLAAQSGMARETVSREIKALKDKDLIDFNHGLLLIKNLNLLKEELIS